jgi:hypothetical protein
MSESKDKIKIKKEVQKRTVITKEIIQGVLEDKLHNYLKIVDIKKKYNIGDSAVSKIVKTYGSVFEEIKGTKEKPTKIKEDLSITIDNFKDFLNLTADLKIDSEYRRAPVDDSAHHSSSIVSFE